MNKRWIGPFITAILCLIFDIGVLIQGIIQQQKGRVVVAILALAGIIAYLYFLLLCNNTNSLKPVRVRSRN